MTRQRSLTMAFLVTVLLATQSLLVNAAEKHTAVLQAPADGLSQYLPAIKDGDSYSFSEAQRKRMAQTPLNRELFIQYIEKQWPLARIKAFCTPENVFPLGYQNLVVEHSPFRGTIPIHSGQKHDFDKILVYVDEDNGRAVYHGSIGTTWRRWTYSLNIVRGNDHWVAIRTLPNDFMDNPSKYVPQPQSKRDQKSE